MELVQTSKSLRSASTSRSSEAARKKLEYEAAKRQALIELELATSKALIEKNLISKKLEADLAELEENDVCSSLRSQRVGTWLEEQNSVGAGPPPSPSVQSNKAEDKDGSQTMCNQESGMCPPIGGDNDLEYLHREHRLDYGGNPTPRHRDHDDGDESVCKPTGNVFRTPHDSRVTGEPLAIYLPRPDGCQPLRDHAVEVGNNAADWQYTYRAKLADNRQNAYATNMPTQPPPPPHDRKDTYCAGAPSNTTGGESDIKQLVNAIKELIPKPSSETNGGLLARLATSKDLPVFDGDPLEWMQFKECFSESSRLCKYSDAENVWRLRKCLRGEARQAATALLIGSTTADAIMDTLELSFGRPECIINKIVTQLRKVNPLPMAYHTEIVAFSVKIKNYVTAVKALKLVEYIHSPELTSTVLNKLPPALINKWAEYMYERRDSFLPKLELLSQFLNREAMIAATSNVTYLHGQEKKKGYENSKGHIHTMLACDAAFEDKCKFCRSTPSHALENCNKFKRAMRRDRWQFVRQNNRCFKCLGVRHPDPSSCRASDCRVCGHPHHPLLHWTKPAVMTEPSPPRPRASPRAPPTTPPTPAPRPRPRTPLHAHSDGQPAPNETVAHANVPSVPSVPVKVFLKVVPITLHGPDGASVHTHALLDDGATVTLIAADIADLVGLHGETVTMRARSAWSSGELVCQTETVSLNISNSDGERFNLRARKMKELNLPIQYVSNIDFSKYPHLDYNYNLCKCDTQPKLLIGQDNYDLIAPLICIRADGKQNEPYITKTPLGWCVHGIINKFVSAGRSDYALHSTCAQTCKCNASIVGISDVESFDALFTLCASDDGPPRTCCSDCVELNEFVRRSFSLDSIGILSKPRQNADELRAITILNNTCNLVNDEWFVGLPWKNDDFVMPDSYPNALNRLKSVERKMLANESFASRYQDRIQHLFSNNYARKVNEGESGDHVWYLPHFGVDNPNKSKLRLVFDAASKVQGCSLNDFLLQGPDLLQSLFGIMFRFRENEIGVVGDIKDMFLRIKIIDKDQHAFRFLFGDEKYVMNSLIFGANCSPFIAQFIKNKNASRYAELYPEAVDAIRKQHYMDDYIDSLPDLETSKCMIREVTYIHQQGGFEIRNWASNVPAVLEDVPKEALSDSAFCLIDCDSSQTERTLGLLWYPASDELGFDLSLKRIPVDILDLKRKPTKREMLRIIMSIFDIHGFLGPFTIKAKILMQKTWKTDLEWDRELPEDLYNIFAEWLKQLKGISDIRIPRYLFRNQNTPSTTTAESVSETLELHVFCDASPSAYAAVAYWRKKRNNNKSIVAFIASKSRVAPTKLVTIPRLELQGALLGCRLAETIKKEHRLKPTATFFWTDSTTVLHWIRNESRNYKVFIANRLGEIDELSKVQEWHYVPTDINIADLATKNKEYDLKSDCDWFLGPPFLHDDTTNWPQEPKIERIISDEILEKINTVNEISDATNYLPVPKPSRFSSWLRLLRATACVFLFVEKCRKKRTSGVTIDLMERAERLLLQHSQLNSFPNDIALLKQGKQIKRDSRLRTLTPELDEYGILRVSGRIAAAKDVAMDTKSPVILDGRDHVAQLIVKQYHVNTSHGFNEQVVNELRQKYWLIRLRPTIRAIAARCMFCRIRKARPNPPRLGDLPEGRLTHHQRPFSHTGVDCFGPMEVTVGRSRPKRYGVLFTCLVVRAVHIEIVPSLSADSLIMALRRMAARRGWPSKIYSDNGTNMRGADVELKKAYEAVDKDTVMREALNKGVDWNFIPPASPHMGGSWERLVRSVKTALKVVLKSRAPHEETLITLLAEVENTINSRPLTHVSVDPRDSETLTPNHFLIGSSSNLPTPGAFSDKDLILRKRWRIAQRLADLFWTRWVREVLPDLVPRQKWQQEGDQLTVGDVVIIVEPSSPRNAWPKGVIQAVYPGTDGRVRVVDIKTKSGILKRPAARVAYLLSSNSRGECRADTEGENVDDKINVLNIFVK